MNNLKISIIVPVFNVSNYLDKCVLSILNQTYSNIEVILVDDGSTDGSGIMCDNYAVNDSRVKVVHKLNGGLSDARNKGLEKATGDYIGFVDSDDYIESQMYECLIKSIEKYNADIACCGRYIDDNSYIHQEMIGPSICVLDSRNAIKELLVGKIINEAAWDKLYKKDIFTSIRYPFSEINEDIVTTPRLFQKAKKIVYINKPLYHYYMRNGSITKSSYNSNKSVIYHHILWVETFINNNYKDLHEYFYNYEFTALIGVIGDISNSRKIRFKFEEDYKKYTLLFERDFNAMMRSKKVDKYIKVKAWLVKTHLYLPMKNIKDKLKRY